METTTLPGTLIEVFGTGVLLTGPSGIGKSEAALGLIERGHCLIADDAVVIIATDGALRAQAQPLQGALLALRDLGVVDVSRLFGAASHKATGLLEFGIELEPPATRAGAGTLAPRLQQYELHGITLPRLHLTAAPGRNLPLLIETAARDFQVRRQGYHADEILSAAQQRALKGEVR